MFLESTFLIERFLIDGLGCTVCLKARLMVAKPNSHVLSGPKPKLAEKSRTVCPKAPLMVAKPNRHVLSGPKPKPALTGWKNTARN